MDRATTTIVVYNIGLHTFVSPFFHFNIKPSTASRKGANGE